MTKKQKRLEKLRENTRNVSLEEFEAVVNEYGFIKASGKHPKAVIAKHVLPYARTNPVKEYYVKMLLQLMDSM
jgi:hypothetical protein